MYGLAKLASLRQKINTERLLKHAPFVPLYALGGLVITKRMHNSFIDAEPNQDIRAPLSELSSRKDKMQAVRTAFQDQFGNINHPEIDVSQTEVKAGRSLFPWKDRYTVDVMLKDKEGKEISDWDTYMADVYKDKGGDYTGYLNMIFTRDDLQGKGIGTLVENKMVDSFRAVGATKAKLMPLFDGPLVWAKEKFGYELSPNRKKTFLNAYKKYTKEKGFPFEDLGNKPSDYPEEFLRDLDQYEDGWKSTYYEKPLEKAAGDKGGIIMHGLVKLANYKPIEEGTNLAKRVRVTSRGGSTIVV